jgi:hypothetical protein
MATWAEFARGSAEVLRAEHGERGTWEPVEGGASALAEAGERLLGEEPGIALLATVSAGAVPRVHPFMPRILDGRLCAFIVRTSPKLRDLLEGRLCVIHAPAPAPKDEEFWVRGTAVRIDEPTRIEAAVGTMPWAKRDSEVLVEFDLEQAGWTRWLDFGTSTHRPLHHRWRAA